MFENNNITRHILFFCCFMIASLVMAQSSKVTGIVYDDKGTALPGANILLVGTSIGVSTNLEGKFEIKIPNLEDAKLRVTYIGLLPQIIDIKGQKHIVVKLTNDAKLLDDVVVVGYGQMRKSDLTGAVSSIKIEESEARNTTSIQSLIQGKAAGVQITSGDASPGGAISMKIRGTGSLTGSSEPLYVIDGIMMSSPMAQTTNTGQYGAISALTNGMSGVNPQDIESIEILKDASATAIYGSLGANGVVLITTKSGKQEKTKIQYVGTTSMSMMANKREVANLLEYCDVRSKTNNSYMSASDKIDVDWQDYATRKGLSQSHRLNFNGKSGATAYYISGGFAQNQGVIKTTGNKIGDLRFNIDQDISKKLKLGVRSSFYYTGMDMTQGSDQLAQNNSGLVRQMTVFQPYKYQPNANVDYTSTDESNYGAAPWLLDYIDHTDDYRVLANVYLNYKFNNRLSSRISGNVDFRNRFRTQYYGLTTWLGKQEAGLDSKSSQESQYDNMDWTLLYNLKKKKHKLDATLGVTAIQSSTKNNLYTIKQFSNTSFKDEGVVYGNSSGALIYQEMKITSLSALSRLVYNYDERFILTSTFRADGTSKFSSVNRWSYFPSFAFAYRLDQEKFMQGMPFVSNAKFRLGWGMVGNQAISAYQTLPLYSSSLISNADGNGTNLAFNIAQMTNKNLKWETTSQYNLGTDLGFFHNRLNFIVDAYSKRSYNLLQTIQMPLNSGYATMAINRGTIENRGIEFSFDVTPIKQADFSLNVGANISLNRNKIVNIGLPQQKYGAYTWAAFQGNNIGYGNYFKQPANIYIEGQPVGLFYGIRVDGIISQADVIKDRTARLADYNSTNGTNYTEFYQIPSSGQLSAKGTLPTWNGTKLLQAGDFKYFDADGDGKISSSLDKTIIGNPNPKFTYGFTINLNYKQFFVNAAFNGVYGNQVVNSNRMMEEDLFSSYSNVTKRAYDSYYKSQLDANGNEVGRINTGYPRLNYTGDNGMFTSFIVEDGSFLRLSNLTLGYNVKFKKSKGITGLGLSVYGRNIFCITNYTGYDPEVNSFTNDPLRYGVDWASYPNNHTYGMGITVDF